MNPFNQDAVVASNVKVLGFYKGSTVIRQNLVNECSIAGTIWMRNSYSNTTTINHEFGHSVQERILGPAYLMHIAIPSVLYWLWCGHTNNRGLRNYYSNPWERTADFFGGIDRTTLTSSNEKIVSYKSNSMGWAIAENILGPIVILFYLLFGY